LPTHSRQRPANCAGVSRQAVRVALAASIIHLYVRSRAAFKKKRANRRRRKAGSVAEPDRSPSLPSASPGGGSPHLLCAEALSATPA
jgi:hypothetical protein